MTQPKHVNIDCDLRFGHCDGHTDMTYDFEGKCILTCGVDNEVRLWRIDEEDSDPQSFPIDVPAYGIVCNYERYYVASDANAVKSYALSDGESELTTMRFTSNVYNIDMSGDGNLIVAGSGDFTIKLIKLSDGTQKMFEGHEAPILSVALDPKHQLVASSSCDGSVRIWAIEDQRCVHFWANNHAKSNDFVNSSTLCRIGWEKSNGQCIAIPKQDQVNVYDRESWELTKTYKNDNFTNISIVAYSYNGIRIAAANTSGTIMIWDTLSTHLNPIAVFYHSMNITCLKWNPKIDKQMCFCDNGGEYGILKIKSNFVSDTAVVNHEKKITNEEFRDMFGDLSDDDFEKEIDDDNKKSNDAHKVIDELPNISYNSKSNAQKSASKSSAKTIGNDDIFKDTEEKDFNQIGDDDNEFDIGAIKSQYEPQIFGTEVDDDDDNKSDNRVSSRVSHVSLAREPELPRAIVQKAFQPGSTPMHFQQRFMMWNSVGVVLCHNTETENSIDVEFHDTTMHHSIHIPNVQNYVIADVSPEALILATNGEDGNGPSKLFCMLLSTWDATKEWQIDMPKNELIDAITLGTGFITIATDQRFIRIFTIGGIQTHMFSIPGPVLCLSAHEQLLMVIYHSGSGLPEEQSLAMLLLKIDHKSNTCKQSTPNAIPVAVSPKSQVSWAGFTDEGSPCVADFAGVVRCLKDFIGNTWIPIACTKENNKDKSDHYFIIGLSEIQSQIRCVFCKRARYPDTLPRPTMMILPLQIPFCELYTSKGKHEEEQIRHKMLGLLLKKLANDGFDVDSVLEESDKKVIDALIKIFALALGAKRESLALEIAYLMPNERAVEGAIKYAHVKGHRTLAQKLTEVAKEKLHEEINESELINDEHAEQINPLPGKWSVLNAFRETNDVQLKPKSMRNNVTIDQSLNSRIPHSDVDSDAEMNSVTITRSIISNHSDDENSADSCSLKPKTSKGVPKNKGNPFKVVNSKRQSKTKRHYSDESGDEDNDDKCNGKNDGIGFEMFYEEMRDQIQEDNSDIEDEEQLLSLAKKHFESLESKVKRHWNDKASGKLSKKRKSNDISDKNKKNKSNAANSITNFFNKN